MNTRYFAPQKMITELSQPFGLPVSTPTLSLCNITTEPRRRVSSESIHALSPLHFKYLHAGDNENFAYTVGRTIDKSK
jgi:hypothetical protein